MLVCIRVALHVCVIRSELVSEQRRAVSKVLGRDWSPFSQRTILARLTTQIQRPDDPPSDPSNDQTAQTPRVAEIIVRRHFALVDLAGHHTSQVREREQDTNASRTFPIRRTVAAEPGNVGARAEITGGCDQVCRKVVHARADGRQQQCVSCNPERSDDDARQEARFVLVGQDGADPVDDGAPNINRDDEVLGLNGRVFESVLDDDREKSSEA